MPGRRGRRSYRYELVPLVPDGGPAPALQDASFERERAAVLAARRGAKEARGVTWQVVRRDPERASAVVVFEAAWSDRAGRVLGREVFEGPDNPEGNSNGFEDAKAE